MKMSAEETIARVKLVESEIETLAGAARDLLKVARQHEGRLANLEELFQQLVELQVRADERADRADERADRADARMDRFDARMDRFVATIETYIKGRGSNGTKSNDEGNF
jgi:hypothetical protein